MKFVYNKSNINNRKNMRMNQQQPSPSQPNPNWSQVPSVVKVESTHHTMFISDLPEETLPVDLKDDKGIIIEDMPEQFWVKRPARKQYTLYIGDFEENEKGLNELFYAMRDAGPYDELDVHISSPGGYLSELIRFQSIFKETFHGRVTTVLDSYGYSCGAFCFSMGDHRVISEFSEIMFHAASFGAFGETYKVKAQHDFVQNQLDRFCISVMKPYFTHEEIDNMLKGKDYWMNSAEMSARGLADEVIVDGIPLLADDYLNLVRWEELGHERDEFFQHLFEGGEDKIDAVLNPKPKKKAPVKKTTAKKAPVKKTTRKIAPKTEENVEE